MPDVNFYLKKPEQNTGLSLIYLQFKYQKNRVVFTFNQQVKPTAWSKKRQRVKNNSQTTIEGDQHINDLLDRLENVCLTSYRSQLKQGSPNPDVIKQALTDAITGNNQAAENNLLQLIDRFIDNEILFKGKAKKPTTLKSYRVTKNKLLEFSRVKKYPVNFDSITLDFYYRFVNFLQKKTTVNQVTGEAERTISDSAIGNTIKDIKNFMNEAVDLGYTTNMQFKMKKFAKLHEDTDAVYLTWDEIIKLYRHDLTGNKSQEAVRDLFVFGCYVGLRFSDYSIIKPENIIQNNGEYFIKVVTQKTNDLVIIPCSPIVLEIFEKYKDRENKLPKAISNQKFNDIIKTVCEDAKLTETGRLITGPDLPLWQCVSSHTARRSFATNYYLEGFPVIDLMRITGHRTEKAFLTYIKVSKLDSAKRLGAHIKKNWGAKLLKIAI